MKSSIQNITASQSGKTCAGLFQQNLFLVPASLMLCFACAATPETPAAEVPAADPATSALISRIKSADGPDAVKSYNAYQWALWNGAELVLAPKDGYLYPATVNPGSVLESMPPKLSVKFLNSGDVTAEEITALVSPTELAGDGWKVQRWIDGAWSEPQSFVFNGRDFDLGGSDRVQLSQISTIRFLKKQIEQ